MADKSRSGKGEMNINRAAAGAGGGGIGGKGGSRDLKKRVANSAAAGDSSARVRSTKSGAEGVGPGGSAQMGGAGNMSGAGTRTTDVPPEKVRGSRHGR